MKKIATLITIILLAGCSSSNIPTEQEVLTAYNSYGLQMESIKVNDVKNLDCKLTGYDFPNEELAPYYECNGVISFTSGHTIKENMQVSRRMNGELILDSTSITKVGSLYPPEMELN